MMHLFLPNISYDNIFDIDFQKLSEKGNIIIFDYDNTLMPWGSDIFSNEILNLFDSLKTKGFKIIIATNGKGDRYDKLRLQLSGKVELVTNAKKPSTKKIKKFLCKKGINDFKYIFIGDNLITDIFTGNKLNAYTIKVQPIQFREYWAIKIYRFLEIFIILLNCRYFKKIKCVA